MHLPATVKRAVSQSGAAPRVRRQAAPNVGQVPGAATRLRLRRWNCDTGRVDTLRQAAKAEHWSSEGGALPG